MIFLFSLAIFIIDQLSKIIITRLFNPGDSVAVISNVFHITLVLNRGAAFGVFSRSCGLFVVTGIFLSAALIISCIFRSSRNYVSHYARPISMIFAGAIGNLTDRIRFGYVIDFLDFRIWPVFNIADSVITVGGVMLMWQILRSKKKG